MYDMTVRQLHDQVAEYHRTMARVQGASAATISPARPKRIREAVAGALVSLAERIAPPMPERRTA